MAQKYENGSASKVIVLMAEFAIRDQRALIKAYTPSGGSEPDAQAAKVILECKSLIRDFRVLRANHMSTQAGAIRRKIS